MTSNEPIKPEPIEKKRWVLQEQPFTSSVPVIGVLIVAFRNMWNSVAAKWYVRSIAQQQSEFNLLQAQLIDHLNGHLADGVRENSEFSTDIAEVATLLYSLNHSIDSLENRIAKLEEQRHGEEE
jgi:septal ring factor EnvC (AmiA/AmiB activator)